MNSSYIFPGFSEKRHHHGSIRIPGFKQPAKWSKSQGVWMLIAQVLGEMAWRLGFLLIKQILGAQLVGYETPPEKLTGWKLNF